MSFSIPVEGHRWGLLESVASITDSSNKTSGVLFKCDCGKYVKVSIPAIRACKVPEGCDRCVPKPNKQSAKYKASQARKKHPGTYVAWKQARKRMCVRWKRSFYRFFTDLGPRPKGDFKLCRHDMVRQHSPENTFWGMGAIGVYPIYFGGRRITFSWLAKEHGVSADFARRHAKQGVRDAEKILELWRQRNEDNPRNS